MSDARSKEALFAMAARDFVDGDGFAIGRGGPLSPLRVTCATVGAPLLAFLEEETRRDPFLRVLCDAPLPLSCDCRSYTLFAAEKVLLPPLCGRLVRATEAHAEAVKTLTCTMYEATEELTPSDGLLTLGESYLWEDEGAVAMARVAFRGDRFARINTVVTRSERRGRGYGAMLVGSLARLLLAEGRIPTVLANRSNPISHHLYTRLGFSAEGVLYEYRFGHGNIPRESAITCGTLSL